MLSAASAPVGRSAAPAAPRLRRPLRHTAAAAQPSDAAQGNADAFVADAVERFDKCVEAVKRNFATVRTGRASASLLDRIVVDYYGAVTPLKSMASISTPDASTLTIQPFDRGAIKDIERALNASDVGLTPGNDGATIRLVIPQLTEARRKELGKTVGKLAEEGRVSVRNVRRDALKALDKLEKDKALSEDGLASAKDALQKRTDAAIKAVDAAADAKVKDLNKL